MPTNALRKIANNFVVARRSATALAKFPGAIPPDLNTGYMIQDFAIDQWSDSIGGWKVGRLPEHLEKQMGCDRLAGPIFAQKIKCRDESAPVPMSVFVDGFAAIEAEFIAVIGKDAPADKLSWSIAESTAMINDLCIGIEIASSPLATINKLGPPVVASDFGNNAGLIIGPSIRNWSTRELNTLKCESFVNGQSVGSGGAYLLTGGYVRSVQFVLELAAARGRPLQAGAVIATGQTNGIHNVVPDQNGRVSFGSDGEILFRITAAKPVDD